MRSMISSSEKKGWFSAALFKKNAARFWPLWAAYAATLFFTMPMSILRASRWNDEMAPACRTMIFAATEMAAVYGAVFGLLYAMALFSYLMDHKAVGMFHALPVRREGLFLTNYALALCGFLIPGAAVGAITVMAGAAVGASLGGEVLLWLLTQVVVGMFFFSFAVCCAMFTGHILALPVFYGILNVLVLGLATLLDQTLELLLTGYAGRGMTDGAFTRWCTPVWNIITLVHRDRIDYDVTRAVSGQTLSGLTAALGYAIVLFALFSSIALWVYHLRELERAGDVVTVGWMRPVFQWGLGVCVGLTGGVALYQQFFYGLSPWVFILLTAACGVVGAFAGRMLLKKSVRVLADGWRTPVVLGVCMAVVLGAVWMDFFGYQRWVPRADKVEQVRIIGLDSAPWDRGSRGSYTLKGEDARVFLEVHRALVSDLDALREDPYDPGYAVDENGYETRALKYLRVTYQMTDGSTVSRKWDRIPVTAGDMADPDSYTAKLQAFLDRPGVVQEIYRPNFIEGDFSCTVAGGWLNNAKAEKFSQDERGDIELDAGQARKLWEAVQEDMAAGDLGRRYLMDSEERYANCYQTDLVLTFLYQWVDSDGVRQSDSSDMEISLQRSAKKTLEVLAELGYEERLVPWKTPGEVDTVAVG